MTKLFAALWHIYYTDVIESRGAGGYYCESAEADRSTKEESSEVLNDWIKKRQDNCQDPNCSHTPIITDKFSPIIVVGMTTNMVKI